jgi:hypothetical protein
MSWRYMFRIRPTFSLVAVMISKLMNWHGPQHRGQIHSRAHQPDWQNWPEMM